MPVNPLSSDDELQYLASHSEAVLAVARAADAARGRRLGLRRVLVCGADADDPDSLSALVERASADVPTGHRADPTTTWRSCVARGPQSHAIITMSYWPEHERRFRPVWDELLRTLTLGVYI